MRYWATDINVNETINLPATFSAADAIFGRSEPKKDRGIFYGACLCATPSYTCEETAIMASGDVLSLLENCVKKLHANTAQSENFLR